ncbi:hypothetical protein ACOSQ4_012354 [Xanthoceras sorbifolium]
MAKVLQLKQQLQNTKKRTLSISDYFLKIKTLGEALMVAGQIVTEYNLVLSVISGLGHDYDLVVVLLSSQHKYISLNTQYMLMVHEQRIDQLNSVSQVEISNVMANYTSNSSANSSRRGHSSNGRGGNNRGGRGRGRSGRWYSNNKLSCQVCGKNGHSASQCYRRFDQTWHGFNQNNNFGNQQHPRYYSNFNFVQKSPQAHFNTNSSAYFAFPDSV